MSEFSTTSTEFAPVGETLSLHLEAQGWPIIAAWGGEIESLNGQRVAVEFGVRLNGAIQPKRCRYVVQVKHEFAAAIDISADALWNGTNIFSLVWRVDGGLGVKYSMGDLGYFSVQAVEPDQIERWLAVHRNGIALHAGEVLDIINRRHSRFNR